MTHFSEEFLILFYISPQNTKMQLIHLLGLARRQFRVNYLHDFHFIHFELYFPPYFATFRTKMKIRFFIITKTFFPFVVTKSFSDDYR